MEGASLRRGECAAHLGLGSLAVRRQCLGRRREAQELHPAEQDGRDHHPGGRAQEARRVGLGQELPPQIVRVLDMAIAEEAQPGGADHHRQDRDQPWGREALRHQLAVAVEGPLRRQQRREDDAKVERLLPVATLDQREHDAGREHDRRGPPGGLQPPAQAERQGEEGETGEAAQKMRQLDQRQRHDRGEPVEP